MASSVNSCLSDGVSNRGAGSSVLVAVGLLVGPGEEVDGPGVRLGVDVALGLAVALRVAVDLGVCVTVKLGVTVGSGVRVGTGVRVGVQLGAAVGGCTGVVPSTGTGV